MLKKTGAGKCDVDQKYSHGRLLKALLYNFNVDDDTVKPEHTTFLKTTVVPLLEGGSGHIWMQGSASRSGTDQYNMELSRRRVKNVAIVLKSFGIGDGQMQLNAVGEEFAKGHILEDEADRAVALVVIPVAHDEPPPPPKIPDAPPTSDVFKVRMLAGLSASAGPFQVENLFFQIADTKNNLTSFYVYSSEGVGKGLIPKLFLSGTLKGPWNVFRTTSPIRVSQFAGAARFTTAGGGPWTKNYLNMMGLPKGVSTSPIVLSIETGFTFGFSVSSSVGKMIWNPREEMIYSGD